MGRGRSSSFVFIFVSCFRKPLTGSVGEIAGENICVWPGCGGSAPTAAVLVLLLGGLGRGGHRISSHLAICLLTLSLFSSPSDIEASSSWAVGCGWRDPAELQGVAGPCPSPAEILRGHLSLGSSDFCVYSAAAGRLGAQHPLIAEHTPRPHHPASPWASSLSLHEQMGKTVPRLSTLDSPWLWLMLCP